ncbi:MAG: adenylate/guanylate cyclase domain-containing protein [Pseudomonadota bacterium]
MKPAQGDGKFEGTAAASARRGGYRSLMIPNDDPNLPSRAPSIDATFLDAERSGIKLAIKGRFIAIVALSLWYALTRTDRITEVAIAAVVLLTLGAAHYWLVNSRFDRPWTKYAFITIDIILVTIAIVSTPEALDRDLPSIIVYRFDLFHFYFVILAVAAFSFSPGMVVWTGVGGAIAWLTAFGLIRTGMENALEWGDVQSTDSIDTYLATLLSPNFAGTGSRFQEGVMLIMVAVLLAIVMRRARRTVRLHLEADVERRTISELFGQYVPRTIADRVISDRGSLVPVERTATVLFVDIAGFTELTERLGPTRIVDVLNAYFDAVTQVIGDHNGVVTQFQGDAVLSTFNVPLEEPNHARDAVRCATAILDTVGTTRFGGERLGVRIGVNTGSLIAGNVGGGGRQNYTVHGDAVNLAARLEAMNKSLGTDLLIAESTVDLVSGHDFLRVGEVEVRGLSGVRPVFTVPARPESN